MRIVLMLTALFLMSCAHFGGPRESSPVLARNGEQHKAKPVVVMISIDGCRSDYVDMYQPPNLLKLREQGVSAKGLISTYPSLTFPNHYTLVTGLTAEHHGLVGNHFFDPVKQREYHMNDGKAVDDGSFYGGMPLWVMVANEGMVATSYFWVGSQAEIAGRRPDEYKIYDDNVPNEDRIDQTIEWLRRSEENRPHLITLYFSDVDTAGHRFGPESPETKAALLKVDRELGRLFAEIERLPYVVDVLVVSDHGMQLVDAKKNGVPLDGIFNKDDFRIFGGGPQMYLYAKSPDKIDAAYQNLKRAEKNFRVYRKAEIPLRYNFRNHSAVPDLLIDTQIPFSVGFRERLENAKPGGVHGFDPEEKAMWGTFIIKGPQFRRGVRLEPFRNVDVAPLVVKILDLHPKSELDGSVKVFSSIWTSP